MNLPNVYGQGAMFAFSGLDGPTDYRNDFVGSLLGDKLGVLFHLKVRRELYFQLFSIRDIEYNAVTADVIDATLTARRMSCRLSLVFADAKMVVGRTSKAAIPVVQAEFQASCEQSDDLWTQSNPGEYTALALDNRSDEIIFAFAFSPDNIDKAVEHAREGLRINIEQLVRERLKFFETLPSCPVKDPLKEKTFYKAFSVLKANIMTAEGQIKGLWTTPDRIPHKNMWIWDSVFHSIALAYISPQLAYRSLEAVLDGQHESGFIPHMTTPYGSSNITQPPLLAWGIWRIYEMTHDKTIIEKTYNRLKKYIEWNLANRDRNNNYLCEWFIEGDPLCRSGESGMDNSPRFDNAKDMDAVDFSSFMANDVHCLRKMAGVLGYSKDEEYWQDIYNKIAENVNKLLWDKNDNIYYDRDMGGKFNGVKAESCFMPMFAGIAEKWQAERLVKHLINPKEFWTPFPVPSIALSEPTHSTDMWRGSVWINYNYMIILGLKQYGYDELAEQLAQKTVDAVAYWYGQLGSLFEFYDSMARSSPLFLDRKGKCTPPYDIRRKIFPIRDYGWTCALYIAIIMQLLQQ